MFLLVRMRLWTPAVFLVLMASAVACFSDSPVVFDVGLARIDVTPSYPVRLSGYASRKTANEGVAQKIWAKALAIGAGSETALLVTVDNCGISAKIRNDIFRRLENRTNLANERFAICSSHTHTAPFLDGVLPNLFVEEVAPDHQKVILRYTQELTDAIERVALQALDDRQKSLLRWGQGSAAFAANRRTTNGPVDHALPLLKITDTNGVVRGLFASYACHCTTLRAHNEIHGDWAGCAQEYLEEHFPGAVAMIAIGCGADSNPTPRGEIRLAQQYGRQIANEVIRLSNTTMNPISDALISRAKTIQLPFEKLPSLQEWQERAKKDGIIGFHAKRNLHRLDTGRTLPTNLPYFVQTWSFGDDLAMVFLPGEVVVDYSLRIKREFQPGKLWINAYANDVPCYIPSRRILKEGGYEAEDSLWYYDQPARLAPDTEDLIVEAVHDLLQTAWSKNK